MSGSIYFLTDGHAIKVGYAADVSKRIGQMQSGNPRRLICVTSVSGSIDEEREIHRYMRARLVGEWYRPHAKLVVLVAALVRHAGDPAAQRAAFDGFLLAEREKKVRFAAINLSRAKRQKAQFPKKVQAMVRGIVADGGTAAIARQVDHTEASVRLWVSGEVVPTALALARIGIVYPAEVRALFCNEYPARFSAIEARKVPA